MEKRNWDKVVKFEDTYNRKVLSRLSARESLKIWTRLYGLGIKLGGKKYTNDISMEHIANIIATKRKIRVLAR